MFLAKDTHLTATVTLRLFHVDDAHARAAVAKAAALARAQSASGSVLDAGVVSGIPFIVTRPISFLPAALPQRRSSRARLLKWAAQVAGELKAMHDAGFIHGSFQPESFGVDRRGRARLVDFGCVSATTEQVDRAATTNTIPPASPTGPDAGAVAYMSPEMLRGEPLTPRADQWSWGVVFLELLAGAPPWGDTHGPSLLDKIAFARIGDDAWSRTPAGVRPTLARALSADESQRFHDFRDITRSIAAYFARARALRIRSFAAMLAAFVVAVVFATAVHIPHRAGGQPNAHQLSAAESAATAKCSASAELAAARQAVRDSALEVARRGFAAVVAKDPSCASAHLWWVIATAYLDSEARAHFTKAYQYRDNLTVEERGYLSALEPWTRVPPDTNETLRRLRVIAESPDATPESWHVLAIFAYTFTQYAVAIQAAEKAFAADPGLADALRVEGRAHAARGDVSAASTAFEGCVNVSSMATSCLRALNDIYANEGDCDRAEQNSRAFISVDPESPRGYLFLARALNGKNAPDVTIETVLDQAYRRMDGAGKIEKEHWYRTILCALRGDFPAAKTAVLEWEKWATSRSDDDDHYVAMAIHAEIEIETGHALQADKLAADYLSSRAGWVPENFDLDPSLLALRIRYRAGGISRAAFNAKRATWLARETAKPFAERGYIWVESYAVPAVDRDDAADALGVLPDYSPLPDAMTRTAHFDAAIGATYVLAGDSRAALPYLQRATRSCTGLTSPFDYVRAHYFRGLALEHTGDTAAACEAYRQVLARWPASQTVTGRLAANRASALGCNKG